MAVPRARLDGATNNLPANLSVSLNINQFEFNVIVTSRIIRHHEQLPPGYYHSQHGLIVKSSEMLETGLGKKRGETIVLCAIFAFREATKCQSSVWGGRQPDYPQPVQIRRLQRRSWWTLSVGLPQHIPSSNFNHSWQPMGLLKRFRTAALSLVPSIWSRRTSSLSPISKNNAFTELFDY